MTEKIIEQIRQEYGSRAAGLMNAPSTEKLTGTPLVNN